MEMDYIRLCQLQSLQRELGYEFRDISLLDLALTHTSYAKGDGNSKEHNERLEFLGDAVLELCVSEVLYNEYGSLNEGAMTRARAMTVCESSLYRAAGRLGIGEKLNLGHGEDHSGGRNKPSILSDAMEAVIGAVYLEGGLERARELVHRILGEYIPQAVTGLKAKDYKTSLQEYVQKKHMGAITYQLADASGPDHRKTFTMNVCVDGKTIGSGTGGSKQEAGQQAAKAAMKAMGLTD